jgi:hypothetical protein
MTDALLTDQDRTLNVSSGRQAAPSTPGTCHHASPHTYAGCFIAPSIHTFRIVLPLLVTLTLHGCAVVTVAGATTSVVATAVSITAIAVETTVDVATAGVDAVVGVDEDGEDETDD